MTNSDNALAPETVDRPPTIPVPPWDMYTVLVALLSGYILLPILVSNLLLIMAPFTRPEYQIFISQGVTLLTWIGIFAFLGWRYRTSLAPYLGLEINRPLRYYVMQTLLVVSAMLALMLLLNLIARFTGAPPDQPYERFTSQELKVITVFAVISAPLLEEVVFRGFVQSTLHRTMGSARAVISTTLIFLLFHGLYFDKIQALLYVLVLGLILGYWRERTQSILPGMLGHLFNNALASAAMFWR